MEKTLTLKFTCIKENPTPATSNTDGWDCYYVLINNGEDIERAIFTGIDWLDFNTSDYISGVTHYCHVSDVIKSKQITYEELKSMVWNINEPVTEESKQNFKETYLNIPHKN